METVFIEIHGTDWCSSVIGPFGAPTENGAVLLAQVWLAQNGFEFTDTDPTTGLGGCWEAKAGTQDPGAGATIFRPNPPRVSWKQAALIIDSAF